MQGGRRCGDSLGAPGLNRATFADPNAPGEGHVPRPGPLQASPPGFRRPSLSSLQDPDDGPRLRAADRPPMGDRQGPPGDGPGTVPPPQPPRRAAPALERDPEGHEPGRPPPRAARIRRQARAGDPRLWRTDERPPGNHRPGADPAPPGRGRRRRPPQGGLRPPLYQADGPAPGPQDPHRYRLQGHRLLLRGDPTGPPPAQGIDGATDRQIARETGAIS